MGRKKKAPHARRRRLKACKECGELHTYLSQHGLCVNCSVKRHQEVVKQLKEKKGPIYELWRLGMKRAAEKRHLKMAQMRARK